MKLETVSSKKESLWTEASAMITTEVRGLPGRTRESAAVTFKGEEQRPPA